MAPLVAVPASRTPLQTPPGDPQRPARFATHAHRPRMRQPRHYRRRRNHSSARPNGHRKPLGADLSRTGQDRTPADTPHLSACRDRPRRRRHPAPRPRHQRSRENHPRPRRRRPMASHQSSMDGDHPPHRPPTRRPHLRRAHPRHLLQHAAPHLRGEMVEQPDRTPYRSRIVSSVLRLLSRSRRWLSWNFMRAASRRGSGYQSRRSDPNPANTFLGRWSKARLKLYPVSGNTIGIGDFPVLARNSSASASYNGRVVSPPVNIRWVRK